MSAQGYVVTTMELSIDTDQTGSGLPVQVECGVTGVDWNTNSEEVTWQVACPDGYGAGSVKGEETLDVSYVIDYRDGTLSRLLDEHHGVTADIKWKPDPENAPDYVLAATVVLQRGTKTHQVGSLAAGTATWPVKGAGVKPVTTP